MAMEPPDPGTAWAAGQGHLRVSDADRERAVDVLKNAFAEGRLDKSELVSRAGQAMVSKTYAELRAVVAEIPARRPPAPPRQAAAPPRPPRPARPVSWKAVAWIVSAVIAAPGLSLAFFATQYGSFYIMVLAGCIAAGLTGAPAPHEARRHVY